MAFNMSNTKNEMPHQDPNIRRNNFDEVALGYSEEAAILEAKRCIQCKNPKCIEGCPVQINIPLFIKKVSEGEFEEAYKIITRTSSLPAICGRVCPQESQCEKLCARGIKGEAVAIGRLERFVADWHNKHIKEEVIKPELNGYKVAIVGSGPAGLTCAAFLARSGVDVTIYEKHSSLGGVIEHGIPEFRLERSILDSTINKILELGIDVKLNQELGKDFSLEDLEKTYDAIFLSFGKNISSKMGIDGEELNGVYGGNELLEYNVCDKAVVLICSDDLQNSENACSEERFLIYKDDMIEKLKLFIEKGK